MEKNRYWEQFVVGKYMTVLQKYGRFYMNHKMSEFSIGAGQYIYLFFLYSNNRCFTQDEITKALDMDKGTTARALKKLEDEGYVIRKIDPEDKRKNRVHLTEKALGFKDLMYQFSDEWTQIMLEGFSAEEIQNLKELLDRMIINGSNYKKELCEGVRGV